MLGVDCLGLGGVSEVRPSKRLCGEKERELRSLEVSHREMTTGTPAMSCVFRVWRLD